MATAAYIRAQLEDYKQNDPESRSVLLRLSLAKIMCRRLGELGYTLSELADKAGMPELRLLRIIHSDRNTSFETAGRILFALGVEAELISRPAEGGG